MHLDWKYLTLSATTMLVIDEALRLAFRLTQDDDFEDARFWVKEGLEEAREKEAGVLGNNVDDVTLEKFKSALQIAFAQTGDEKYRFALLEILQSEEEGENNEPEEDLEDGE